MFRPQASASHVSADQLPARGLHTLLSLGASLLLAACGGSETPGTSGASGADGTARIAALTVATDQAATLLAAIDQASPRVVTGIAATSAEGRPRASVPGS